MQRFLASCPPELCSQEEALDLQVAQRACSFDPWSVPAGGQTRFRQVEVEVLRKARGAFSESLLALDELRDAEYDPADLVES